jgi:hypothetical protein
MCVSWDDNQCWFAEFLFLLHKKFIFHFLSAKNGFFCEASTKKYVAKIEQPNFKWYYIIFYPQYNSYLHWKFYIATPQKKTNIYQFSWKRVKFELQVLHSLLMFFSKNHFEVHNYLFHQRSIKSLAGFDPDLGAVMPTVLVIFWNLHKKFKNNQNNTNPSRFVMFCDLVSRKK